MTGWRLSSNASLPVKIYLAAPPSTALISPSASLAEAPEIGSKRLHGLNWPFQDIMSKVVGFSTKLLRKS
jgi:hypothetical protein